MKITAIICLLSLTLTTQSTSLTERLALVNEKISKIRNNVNSEQLNNADCEFEYCTYSCDQDCSNSDCDVIA